MIPADIASRLRLVTQQEQPAPTQPVATGQKLADALSQFSVGQRLMAEIQGLLPNGAYRAMVAQREVTLALPFAAKPGDTLELEVTQSEGKLTLAFVADRSGQAAGRSADSVATTLSAAGRLIGNLVADVDQQGKRPAPAPLNANQPLVKDFPKLAADLAPVLKEALSKSGMFYESHQARWVQGQMSTAALLQEPQGRLSPNAAALLAQLPGEGAARTAPVTASPAQPLAQRPGIAEAASAAARHAALADPASSLSAWRENTAVAQSANPIHPALTPLVQQQLDALATQTYVWHGQVWPGQPMDWEIIEEDARRQAAEGEEALRWQTRLKLDLPALGGVEAALRLGAGGKVEVALVTALPESQRKLNAAGEQLRRQFDAAGLALGGFAVQRGQPHGETRP